MNFAVLFVADAAASDVTTEATAAAAGLPVSLIIGIVVALLALVGVAVAVSRSKRIASDERPQLTGDGAPSSAPKDPLADRVVVDAPVEITEQMTLKEIKAAKAARLSSDYIGSAEAKAEKDRRKGRGESAAAPKSETRASDEPAKAKPDAAEAEPAKAPSAPEPAESAAIDGAEDAARTDQDSTSTASAEPVTEPLTVPPAEPVTEPIAKVEPTPEPKPEAPPTPKAERARFRRLGPESASGVHPAAPAPSEPTKAPAEAPKTKPAPEAPKAPEVDAPESAAPEATKVEAEKPAPEPPAPEAASSEAVTKPRALEAGLEKTRGGFVARIGSLFSGKKQLDDDLVEQLEEVLFTADIGVQTSQRLLEAVQERFGSGEIEDTDRVWDVLRAETAAILAQNPGHLPTAPSEKPFVLMMVGVNGAGKTTTIGKLAAQYTGRGLKVLMIAADTFRAAAVDQLAEWAERVGCEIYRGDEGADPSGVVYDGMKYAEEIGADVVLCDTAGRLQTKKPLMDELRKIVRVADKALPGAPHETVLVIDANTGQNAIQQATLFQEAVPLTGLVLTKLDGTAKGGVIIAIGQEMQLPIYFIGIGESIEDLRRFDAAEFVDALY